MAPHCAISSALIRRQPDGSSILSEYWLKSLCSLVYIEQNLYLSIDYICLARAVDASWREWRSLSARSIFKGYLTRIKALVRGGEPKDVGLTSAQKLVEVRDAFKDFKQAMSL